MNRRQKTSSGDDTHLYKVSPIHLALRMCFHDLRTVPARILCFSNAGLGCIFRKKKAIISVFHISALLTLSTVVALAGLDLSLPSRWLCVSPE